MDEPTEETPHIDAFLAAHPSVPVQAPFTDRDGNPVEAGHRPSDYKNKGGHGGKRSGAGRKTKAELYDRPIRKAEKVLADRLPEVAEALVELALGVRATRQNRDGTEEVYTTLPDRAAAEAILNRIIGKPTEHKEIDKRETRKTTVQILMPDNFREKLERKPTPVRALPDPNIIDTDFNEPAEEA